MPVPSVDQLQKLREKGEEEAPGPCAQVLASAQFINAHSQDVSVPAQGVQQAAAKILAHMQALNYSPATWKTHALNPQVANDAALEWIFFVDLLNFSFWTTPGTPSHTVTVDGTCYTGYWTLPAAIRRASSEGVDLTDARVYASISRDQWRHVMRSDAEDACLPMLDERLDVAHQAGRVLCDKYGGRFANLLAHCGGSAEHLVQRVVDEFPSFRDTHGFRGRSVALYKRAQILAADVWACFEGQGAGALDVGCLTMFADYRVPQALVHFGALRYSTRLREYLERAEREGGELASGHAWEVEIRGNSVWAVECMRRHIRKTSGSDVSAVLIDFYMWDYAKAHAEEMQAIPIHHTRSLYY
ncbi:hypothetical protein GGI15_002016 [Coemansia interrupta]|uniref:Queuosine 5'-phosphate N-glycosylase/hydrolase n=1 Tax=Coemansia interrupta TaxID=1126814 RepID=A0A9W8HG06_9FUNG|nr:hypothetical protein GGI15_002016 [Coemansia interrupta]